MSIKSCPGDNDRAIEMLLNGELPPTDDQQKIIDQQQLIE